MRRVGRGALAGIFSVWIAACGSGAPGAAPSGAPTVVVTAPASAAPSIGANPTTQASPAGLPMFADDEPLLLAARITGIGGGILVMRPDGSGATQLATDVLPGVHKHPDWSPDGKHVVFIDETTERMLIAHLDGTATESVEACEVPGCDYPAWSPDGSRIAFSRYESGDMAGPSALAISVLDLASGEVDQVVRLERPLLADSPRWSPDGTEIVFQVDRMDDEAFETGAAIAVVPVEGGEPRYLTEFDAFAGGPDWGPNDEIVFSEALRQYRREPVSPGDTWNIFSVRPDGTGLRQITQMPAGQRLVAVRWSPDGTQLIAKQFDDIAGGGRLVDPETGAVRPFVTDAMVSIPVPRPIPTGT